MIFFFDLFPRPIGHDKTASKFIKRRCVYIRNSTAKGIHINIIVIYYLMILLNIALGVGRR